MNESVASPPPKVTDPSRPYTRLRVEPMSGALGAEVFGPDLSKPLDDEMLDEIRRAFNENLVIFFRDQDASDNDLARFARHFGELAQLPPHRRQSGSIPELLVIDKQPEDALVFGWEWHSDTTHLEIPPLGSVLAARLLPPVGGDTMFANQYMAYDTLSPGMQRMLDGLHAVHANGRVLATLEADDVLPPGQFTSDHSTMSATHPVVRTHPVTGKKALYVNTLHTERFQDMSIAESAPLLQYLFSHSTRPEFTCRFRWRPGSIAFWDNRCCQHLALDDYPGQRRLMHRVQVRGTRPV